VDASAGADADQPASQGPTAAQAIAAGAGSALLGAAATVVLGGLLAFSAGLLVVAAAAGRLIGLAFASLRAAWSSARRTVAAVAIAAAGFFVGQLGLWWYAGTEGGVLSLADYLGQTFGLLVPLQLVIGAGIAWWSAR
jgi:hypothetical protein